MVKVAVPEPVLPVFIGPSSNEGKLAPAKSTISVSPAALNPLSVTVTEVPTGPDDGLNDIVCAFTSGVTVITNVNTLRKSTESITLLNLFFTSITLFGKQTMSTLAEYVLFKICPF